MSDYCAIDFGTSNSAVALPGESGQVRMVELEDALTTMPTAVFYLNDPAAPFDERLRHYGRAAVAAYVEGSDGRLMRSMKSILGSSLVEQSTEVGPGISVRYADVVSGYLRRLKKLAQAQDAAELQRVVLGRPVFFVDGDAQRDASAQKVLLAAAKAVGFKEVNFQDEPIAAALDHELSVAKMGRLGRNPALVFAGKCAGRVSLHRRGVPVQARRRRPHPDVCWRGRARAHKPPFPLRLAGHASHPAVHGVRLGDVVRRRPRLAPRHLR